MNEWILKGLCLTLGLPLSAMSASAQQEPLISAQMMSLAQEDIMRMSETELRSFVAVLVDCSLVQMLAQQAKGAACMSANEKYTIEYQQGRPVDNVLHLLLTATFVHLAQVGPIIIESNKSARQDSRTNEIEDIQRAIREGRRVDVGAVQGISETQETLRRTASQAFRKKRAQ